MTRYPERPSPLLLLLAFAAIYVIWGSTYLAIRVAIETLPPFLMAGARFLVAGLILYLIARPKAERPSLAHWRNATFVGALLLLGGNGGVVWAEQWVPSGLAALLVATVPLWMILFEWIGPDRMRPSRRTLAGLVLGFAGVLILVGGPETQGTMPWIPALVLIGASASWAIGSLVSRRIALPRSAFLATSMEMLGGGGALLATGLLWGEAAAVDLEAVSLRSALGLGYLIVFGSIIAFTAYVWLLRVTSAANVSTYAFVNPMVAVVLGWALASEPLTPRIGLAGLLIIGAVFLVVLAKKRTVPSSLADADEMGDCETSSQLCCSETATRTC